MSRDRTEPFAGCIEGPRPFDYISAGGDMSAGEGGMIHVFVSTFMGYFEKYGGKVNGRTLRF